MRFNGPTVLHTPYWPVYAGGFDKIVQRRPLLRLHQLAFLEHRGLRRNDQNVCSVCHRELPCSCHSRNGDRHRNLLRKRDMR